MRISIPYGKNESICTDIPAKNVAFLVDRKVTPAISNPSSIIRKILRNPIGAHPLVDSVHYGDKVVIVGDDITRPTPQSLILPCIIGELKRAGIPPRDIEAVIALGTHRKMTPKEIDQKYGNVAKQVSITNHDYTDTESLVHMGHTKSGLPVSINRRIREASFVIGVGNIVPHCFAGWGGGGKIIQPGVCGEETTTMTHLMAGKVRPICKLPGNMHSRIRKEIDTVALKAGLKMIVNTVLNKDDKIADVTAGDPIKAFRKGVEFAEDIYCPVIPEQAEIVLVSGYPSDIDFWQATKPLLYASMAAKPGGTVVLLAPCPDGVSPAHPILGQKATLTYDEIVKAIDNGEIGDLTAASILLMYSQVRERVDIVCYSPGLTNHDKQALGVRHADSPQRAVEIALQTQGKNANFGVLKCGDILPRLASGKHDEESQKLCG